MKKKSFIFYTSWKKNIDMMEDDELRRFINNLINHTEGNDVDLPTRMEKMIWNDLVEILNHNERKRERAAERSRENGKKGGRPETQNNLTGSNKTQQVIKEPNGLNENPENLLMDNGKLLMDNSKIDNGQMVDGNMSKDICNKLIDIMKELIEEGIVKEEFVKQMKISDTREILTNIFYDYPSWETDLQNLGLDTFMRNSNKKTSVELDYKIYSTLRAHQIL
jgi:hypothetical protein